MITALPDNGVPATQILDELRSVRSKDLPTHGGQLFTYVYDPGLDGLDELAQSAHALAAHVNGLDPLAFPSLVRIENALVGAAARLLNAGPGSTAPGVVGTATSGGSESIILAVKTARDANPDKTRPNIIAPGTAHAAFAKAAEFLRVELRNIPIDNQTFMPDMDAYADAIDDNTVLLIGSAPSYAHGVIDPLADISHLAEHHGIRFHVDACFGGWLLPYFRRLGDDIPAFDFELPGVTSMSVDLHKFAYCPKGISLLLHRDASLRRAQYFAYADWPGYTMVNSVIASTRSGGPLAAAFATLRHIGDSGYLELAKRTRDACTEIGDIISNTGKLRLITPPGNGVVVFDAIEPELDIYLLADELHMRGWHPQAQLPYHDVNASIHLTVTASVLPKLRQFAEVLDRSIHTAHTSGSQALPRELVAMAQHLTPDQLTPEFVASIAERFGLTSKQDHPRMATVNRIIALAPIEIRERLFVEFISLLQHPTY